MVLLKIICTFVSDKETNNNSALRQHGQADNMTANVTELHSVEIHVETEKEMENLVLALTTMGLKFATTGRKSAYVVFRASELDKQKALQRLATL